MVEGCSVWAWLSDMMILRNYVYRLSLLESVSRVENKLCEEENKLLGFIMEIPYEAVKEMSSSREPKSISWLQSWWSRCPCVGNNYQNNHRGRSKVHNAQKVVLDSVELYIYIHLRCLITKLQPVPWIISGNVKIFHITVLYWLVSNTCCTYIVPVQLCNVGGFGQTSMFNVI